MFSIFWSSYLNALLENIQTISAANEINIAPVITYVHPPNDHNMEDNALPTAPNMKLLTTRTVFNLLRSSLDRLNNLAWVKTVTPWTAIENTAAIRTIAMMES